MNQLSTAQPATLHAMAPLKGVAKIKIPILDRITEQVGVQGPIDITPEDARELLTLNEHNRPLARPMIDRFVSDMKKGDWIFSGNTIKFSKHRKLLDGQHSLTAIMESGTTQQFNIQTGLEPVSFRVMDNGKIRTGADVLSMKGYEYAAAIASAIKSVVNLEKGGGLRSNLFYGKITNIDIDNWTENPSDLALMKECTTYVMKDLGNKLKLLTNAQWIFLLYILSKRHSEQGKEFVTKLNKGAGISNENHSPIYHAREALIGFAKRKEAVKAFQAGGGKVFETKVRLIFTAWNHWRRKENIRKLTFDAKKLKIEMPI